MNNRLKDKRCIVCGSPCCGRTCRDCFQTKNNKHAGRYLTKSRNMVDLEIELPGTEKTYNIIK